MTDTPDAPPAPPTEPAMRAEVGPDDTARAALLALREEVGKAVVGQDSVVTGLVIALLCRGHVLLEGVPGTAKTLMIRALATALDLESTRIQFTPDLMPGDVTGSLVYDSRSTEFSFKPGPVFTNLLLADEVNRTPPKTQASLLEAMEERQVTVEGRARALPDPFVVAATQNPVEYEGTYPLPEAQLDRFLFKVLVGYTPQEAEVEVLRRYHHGFDAHDLATAGLRGLVPAEAVVQAKAAITQVIVEDSLLNYVARLAAASRTSPDLVLGASTRASTHVLLASKTYAALQGRNFVTPDDVKFVLPPVYRHRLLLKPEAEIEGLDADAVIGRLLGQVEVPR